jgi:hypothetical protein
LEPLCAQHSDRLIAAMGWAIENRMDVVNLRLGASNFDYRDKFQVLGEHDSSAGTVLVSSRSTGLSPVLPGVLEGVIEVELDGDIPRNRYRIGNTNGSGYPVPWPGIPPSGNFNGT